MDLYGKFSRWANRCNLRVIILTLYYLFSFQSHCCNFSMIHWLHISFSKCVLLMKLNRRLTISSGYSSFVFKVFSLSTTLAILAFLYFILGCLDIAVLLQFWCMNREQMRDISLIDMKGHFVVLSWLSLSTKYFTLPVSINFYLIFSTGHLRSTNLSLIPTYRWYSFVPNLSSRAMFFASFRYVYSTV